MGAGPRGCLAYRCVTPIVVDKAAMKGAGEGDVLEKAPEPSDAVYDGLSASVLE